MAFVARKVWIAASMLVAGGGTYAQEQKPAELEPLVVETTKPKASKKAAAVKKTPASKPLPQAPLPQETASREREGSAAPTRNTYQPTNTYSATKTDTPVIETPQSITTVTRKQMDDLNAQTVNSALSYSAGILSSFEQNSRYDNVFIRGFGAFSTAGAYVQFLDGMKLPRSQGFGIMSIDPFLLDRIDVMKGPSALLYGQVSPGGLVNMVSRAPSAEPYNELRLEAGSYGRVQAGYTSQGALNKDGTLQYSLTAIGRDSGTRYDDVEEQRIAVAPAIAWQPTEDTRVTLLGFYQNDPEGGYYNSLYAKSLALPEYRPYLNSKLNIGDPSFDKFEREQSGVGYQLEHRFNDAIMFRSALRYAEFDLDFAGLQMSSPQPFPANGILNRWAAKSLEEGDNITADNQLQFDFSTGALHHRVLTGLDLQRANSSTEFTLNFAPPPLNVTNPQYGQPVTGTFFPIISGGQSLDQTGIYIQDQLALGNWRALVGVRQDWTEQVTTPTVGTERSQESEATTYRAGLLYLFDNGLAPYASFATSFEPVIGLGLGNQPFKPTEAEQYEVGIKYQPTFIPALFTFSAFDIVQQNTLVPSAIPGISVQQGEIRSRGLEFEARGNLTKQLELIAALTLLDTEVAKSTTAAMVGNRPQGVPEYFGSLWANYSFDAGALDGFRIGAGIRFVGSSFGDEQNTVVAPAYEIFDAAITYDLGKVDPFLARSEFTLNVSNVFDKEYYSSCSSGFYCQFGDRRTFLAGIRHRW